MYFISFYFLLFSYSKKGVLLGLKTRQLDSYPIKKVLLLTLIVSFVLAFSIWLLTPVLFTLFKPIFAGFDFILRVDNIFWSELDYNKYILSALITFGVIFVILDLSYFFAYSISRKIEKSDKVDNEICHISKKAFYILLSFMLFNLMLNSNRIIIPIDSEYLWRMIIELVIVALSFLFTLVGHAVNGLLLNSLDKEITKYPVGRCLWKSFIISLFISLSTYIFVTFIYRVYTSLYNWSISPLKYFFAQLSIHIIGVIIIFIIDFVFFNLSYLFAYLIIKIRNLKIKEN